MEFKTKTKFNLGDCVHGTTPRKDDKDGLYKLVKFEGRITEIIVTYGKYCDKEISDKVSLKEQYLITYKVTTDDDILITATENNLAITKRVLDTFTIEELEEEINRRKENLS